MERIPSAAGALADFFGDGRFSSFRRKKVRFGKSELEIADPEAVQEEGFRKAATMKGDEALRCQEAYKNAADNLRAAITALEIAGEHSQSGFTPETFSKMGAARNAYKKALDFISQTESPGSNFDEKA